MSDELQPCPFCGSQPTSDDVARTSTYWVACPDCGCEGPPSSQRWVAIQWWNRRPDHLRGLRDALAAAVEADTCVVCKAVLLSCNCGPYCEDDCADQYLEEAHGEKLAAWQRHRGSHRQSREAARGREREVTTIKCDEAGCNETCTPEDCEGWTRTMAGPVILVTRCPEHSRANAERVRRAPQPPEGGDR